MIRALRRKANRSGKMKCDMCNTPKILVEHHIKGRSITDYNHPSNLANICCNCHMDVHSGEKVIEQWILTTGGKMLSWHCRGESGITGNDSVPYQIGEK